MKPFNPPAAHEMTMTTPPRHASELSGLPRFDTILPGSVRPPCPAARRPAQPPSNACRTTLPLPTWANFVDRSKRRRAPRPRLGHRRHMHSVMDTPNGAGLQRDAAGGHRFTPRGVPRAVRKYKAIRQPRSSPPSAPPASASSTTSCAASACPAPSPDDQKPLPGHPGRNGRPRRQFSENLLDATNAFAEWSPTNPSLAGLPPTTSPPPREAADKAGLAGWKFGLKMPSPAGDAVRRQ